MFRALGLWGCRISVWGFRGLGFRGLGVQSFRGFGDIGFSGFMRFRSLGFRGLGFRVQGLGLGFRGLVFGVSPEARPASHGIGRFLPERLTTSHQQPCYNATPFEQAGITA